MLYRAVAFRCTYRGAGDSRCHHNGVYGVKWYKLPWKQRKLHGICNTVVTWCVNTGSSCIAVLQRPNFVIQWLYEAKSCKIPKKNCWAFPGILTYLFLLLLQGSLIGDFWSTLCCEPCTVVVKWHENWTTLACDVTTSGVSCIVNHLLCGKRRESWTYIDRWRHNFCCEPCIVWSNDTRAGRHCPMTSRLLEYLVLWTMYYVPNDARAVTSHFSGVHCVVNHVLCAKWRESCDVTTSGVSCVVKNALCAKQRESSKTNQWRHDFCGTLCCKPWYMSNDAKTAWHWPIEGRRVFILCFSIYRNMEPKEENDLFKD